MPTMPTTGASCELNAQLHGLSMGQVCLHKIAQGLSWKLTTDLRSAILR